MKHARLLLSLLALTFAGGILVVSLYTSSLVYSANNGLEASQRELYFNQEILPDHVAYPLLMVSDRLKLEASAPQERIFMEVEYGLRRLEAAQKLLSNGKKELAVSTFTKSAKYIQQAAFAAQDTQTPTSVRHHVVKASDYFHKEVTAVLDQIPDTERSVLAKLLEENQAATMALR